MRPGNKETLDSLFERTVSFIGTCLYLLSAVQRLRPGSSTTSWFPGQILASNGREKGALAEHTDTQNQLTLLWLVSNLVSSLSTGLVLHPQHIISTGYLDSAVWISVLFSIFKSSSRYLCLRFTSCLDCPDPQNRASASLLWSHPGTGLR